MSDILNHVPDYYDGVLEAQAIYNANDVAIDLIDTKVARTFLNMYVLKADDEGLQILEATYHIAYNPELSIENRRYNLIMKLLPPRPITIKFFKELLKSVSIQADLDVDAIADTFVANLDKANVKDGQATQLNDMLQTYLPANLAYKIYTLSHFNSNLNNFIGVANNLYVHSTSKCHDDITSFETDTHSYIGLVNTIKVKAVSICKDQI